MSDHRRATEGRVIFESGGVSLEHRAATRATGGALAVIAAMVALGVGAAVGLFGAGNAASAHSSPTCFGQTPTILGTSHGEVIRGTSGRDVIMSFGGDDNVLSRQGPDYVCSGSGDDVIHGAEGFNRMNGGPGEDWIDGRRGPGNVVIGGKSADHVQAEGKIDGGPGADIIESYGYQPPGNSPVADVTKGGAGNDDIYGCTNDPAPQRPSIPPGPPRQQAWEWPGCYGSGSPGNAELFQGGADDDHIFGGGGNDNLLGNGGKDRIYGEDGNDAINGGRGSDVCKQGPGTGTKTSCP